MSSNIITYSELLDSDIFGGKCKGVAWLIFHDFTVPRGCVCASNILDFDGNENEILSNFIGTPGPWICRSSATYEDSKSASFAGLFHSEIFHEPDQMNYAIGSIRNKFLDVQEEMVLYNNGIDIQISNIHFLIQEYISGEISGVFVSNLFNRGPLLEYVLGSCDSLVQGTQNAHKIWLTNNYDINSAEGDQFFINQIIESGLIQELKKISHLYSSECDIEWTISNGKVYFLQIRPISNKTTIFK